MNLVDVNPPATGSVHADDGDTAIDVRYVKGNIMHDGKTLVIDGHAYLYQSSAKGMRLTSALK